MPYSIRQILGRVFSEIREQQGPERDLLLPLCTEQELTHVNRLSLFKDKLYIYVDSHAVLYGFNLKKESVLSHIQHKYGQPVKEVVFKIGV